MGFARTYHNMTSLPDGNVLVTGGEGTTNPFDQSTAVYAAEMWSPTSETFTTMASMQTARVYHSTALLLPDGRVLVGGSGEYGTGSIDQRNTEIYSPPYLFKGTRPTVTSSPSVLQYGAQFAVQTPDAANISSVALLRLGSVTHAFNENQRYVPLTFTPAVGSLNVQAPENGNIAPPGYYMLFLVNSNGVPSVAKFVQMDTYTSTSTSPGLGLKVVSGDSGSVTVTAGQTASYTLSLGGAGMSGTASLSCTGAPMGANCSVPPSQSLSSTVPATFSVSVTTISRTSAAHHPPSSAPVSWLWTLAIAMLWIVVRLGIRAPKRSGRRYLYLWLAPLTLLLLVSCGGGSSTGDPPPNPNGTPAGIYTLTVQATSASTTEASSLTLVVQ
jgi:hypothetical protein